MIGIKVNGEFLELSSDTSITMEWNNPIFADAVIPGSYSYPFSIPVGDRSPKNAGIFGNIDIVENTSRITKVAAQVFIDGVPFRSGILECGTTDDGYMAANFIFGLAVVADDLKAKKINEICAQTVVMADNDYIKRVTVCCNMAAYPGATFELIVNGRSYSGTTTLALISAINNDMTEPQANAIWVNSPYRIPGDNTLLANDYFILQPRINARDYKTVLTVDIPEGSDYRKIYVDSSQFVTDFNQPVIDWMNVNNDDTRFCFPMLYNNGMYPYDDIKKVGILDYNLSNHWQTAAQLNRPNYYYRDLIFGPQSTFVAKNVTSVQPFIKLNWVVKRCSEYFGIGLEGDFLSSAEYNTAVFYHSNSLDERIAFVGKKDWIATRRTWDISEFLPQINFIDLLKELINRFCVTVYVNEANGKIRIQTRKSIIESASTLPMTAFASPRGGVNPVGVSYRLEATNDDSDILANDVYQGDDAEDTITTRITGLSSEMLYTLRDYTLLASESYTYNLPVSYRPLDDKVPTVFIFYTGFKTTTGTGSFNYPSAQISSTDGPFKFAGEGGMYQRRWKSWLDFLNTRKEVGYKFDFNLDQIMSLNWERKITVDRNRYLYKTIKIKFGMSKMEQGEVLLYNTL